MNLIVDVGNTYVKLAVFHKKAMLFKTHFKLKDFKDELEVIKAAYPEVKRAILASVGRSTSRHITLLRNYLPVISLDQHTKVPFKNKYASPHTLGVDRIALVSAAVDQFPAKNVLIIDAGTCITYDFKSEDNSYHGGAISPGLRLRYEALHNFTANLPLLQTNRPEDIIGNSTETSIHSGVVFGALKEIDGVIDEYRSKYQDLTVILTGGDAELLSNQLKNSIFASSNFVLEGLNFILDFNSK